MNDESGTQPSMKDIMDAFEHEREWRGCPSGLCQRYSSEDCRCANEAVKRARKELTGASSNE